MSTLSKIHTNTMEFGTIYVHKYESRGTASTALGTTPERLLLMPHNDTPANNSIPYGLCHCGCGEETSIAKYSSQRQGYVKGEPVRYIHSHRARKPRGLGYAPVWNEQDNCYDIHLTRGGVAKVGDEDVDVVRGLIWSYHNKGYAHARIGGKLVMMHRHIMQPPDGLFVDHISGDKLDNRRSNLRLCTKSQNGMNQAGPHKGSGSRFLGVHWHKATQKWAAAVRLDGTVHHIGVFESEVDAAIARDAMARELHGKFASLNFPDEVAP